MGPALPASDLVFSLHHGTPGSSGLILKLPIGQSQTSHDNKV